jgi:hypothetical protein
MEGVSAEVEMINGSSDFHIQGSEYSKPVDSGHTYLDIVLEIQSMDHDQLEEIKQELFSEQLFLHFKDTHPNLIKGRVTGVTIDQRKTTIRFTGNTTNKSYTDYVAECTDQFNAYHYLVSGSPPEPEKKRKDIVKDIVQVFKRKLTF